MRWRPGVIVVLLLSCACALGACHKKGGGGTQITTITAFPQGFLPVLRTGTTGSGDVTFRTQGDLFAVDGSADVTTVSRTTGAVKTFVHVNGNPTLRSIVAGADTDGRLFAGDAAGQIWAISADGTSATVLIDASTQPITGLAVAPTGFGNFGGTLFAAAGTDGILRISTGSSPSSALHKSGNYVDVAFTGTSLLGLQVVDSTHGQIDTIDATGAIPAGSISWIGFVAPVGMAVDSVNSLIYVADAGNGGTDGTIKTVPLAGGSPTKRARYTFSTSPPSGMAFDGIDAIGFIASSPFAIRGEDLPPIDPTNPNYGQLLAGPTVGYGDLEFDRLGGFLLSADAPTQNFLFSISRDGSSATQLTSSVGQAALGEDLLGLAFDPISQNVYIGSRLGNIYLRKPDGTLSLLVSVTGSAILGLELAPQGFGSFGGDLIATTDDGQMFAIDPQAPTPITTITLSGTGAVQHLSDLVFSSSGTLYVVDNHSDDPTPSSRILRVDPTGTFKDLLAAPASLGLADGIEIDEGTNRLLVTSITGSGTPAANGQLLAVDLGSIPAAVSALANVSIDDGKFPTGIVYDGLGGAVVRKGNTSTSIQAVSVRPPP